MKFIKSILLLAFLITTLGFAQDSFNHEAFNSLLQLYVDEQGLVNYRAIKQERLLNNYLEQLEMLNPQDFETWSDAEKMAFWINAYNAITIEGIVRNYPIKYGGMISRVRFPQNSIRQISGFWDTVFIKVMGKEISLNQIEHEILRKEFRDPRIHAVLVCAALGCPQLENKTFDPHNLDERLDQANVNFINNPDKVKLDTDKKKLYLSSILDWYHEDFEASQQVEESLNKYDSKYRGVIGFVLKYLPEDKKEFINKNFPKLQFLDYDWTLNEQP